MGDIASPSFPQPMDKEARTISITMPNSESAYLVLRCAYNEIAAKMFDSNKDGEIYIKYLNAVQKSMAIGKLTFL